MRQTSSSMQSIDRARAHAATETETEFALMRGLVHGAVLSMVVWTAILYLTFGLR